MILVCSFSLSISGYSVLPFQNTHETFFYVLTPQNEEYHGERVTLGTNLAQCTADNRTVCDPIAMKGKH